MKNKIPGVSSDLNPVPILYFNRFSVQKGVDNNFEIMLLFFYFPENSLDKSV